MIRCSWCGDDPLYVAYHDEEWGVPVHDDRHLFEMLILEGAQAGLSWITILRKREAYRKAFDEFDARKIADYKSPKLRIARSGTALRAVKALARWIASGVRTGSAGKDRRRADQDTITFDQREIR